MLFSDWSSDVCSSDLPLVTWGTSPEDVIPVTGAVPDPMSFADPSKQEAARKSLEYMGLTPGMRMSDVQVEHIFIGSCTNSRHEGLRPAAEVAKRRQVEGNVRQIGSASLRDRVWHEV